MSWPCLASYHSFLHPEGGNVKIDTDDYIQIKDAAKIIGVSEPTARRMAKRLECIVTVFGRDIVKKSDVERMKTAKRDRIGNPDWIGSQDAAAAAARKSVKSRMRRIAREGLTKAEKQRIARLPKIGAELGGRPPARP